MPNLHVMSKKKKKGGSFQRDLRKEVLAIFRAQPRKPMNYKQVSSSLGIQDDSLRQLIAAIIDEETERESLQTVGKGRYVWAGKSSGDVLQGKIEITRYGRGFVIVEGRENDIAISKGSTGNALWGDIVEVSMLAGRRSKGRVERVVKRARDLYVCVFQKEKNFAFGLPTDPKMHVDFFLPPSYHANAKDGDKIIVEMMSWESGDDNPIGKVHEVLGAPGDNDVEMHAIMVEYGLPYHFPEEVVHEADQIPKEITEKEVKKRRDMRDILTFTIDPHDAKDFDDALSLQQLENGNWEVGVHIADVTHYMRPGTLLEEEAFNRATSVYLVDRTVPMLPEVLSNELCSLRPNEDKLCFSAVFEMTDKAEIKNQWFGRTVIHSDRRFTYEEAQEVIETGKGDHNDAILTLDRLAKILRGERFKRGGIDFNTEEIKFELGENGKPVGVYVKVMKDANKLIEDFMLLANVKVAERIGKSKIKNAPTFVYRIHDLPDVDKLRNLRDFVSRFGYRMPKPSRDNAEHVIKDLLAQVKDSAEEDVIKTMAIRSMAKAEYSTNNIGHYGLSFDFYSHFTSPIRRYPDVMVHRLLQHYLDGGESVNADDYDMKCRHSSEQEKKAADAERASIKYKQVEFMLARIGQTFKGIVSGVTSWGLYVEVHETKCEGMVAKDSMKDDFYIYDEEHHAYIGKRTGQEYHFGDEVTITVVGADLLKRQLDFELVHTMA